MATNGNERMTPEVAAALGKMQEKAIAAMTPASAGVNSAAEANVMSLMAALSDRCRNMADTMVTNADDDRKEAYDFSNHLLDLARRWGDELLKRKRRELAELEAFLGKVAK